MKYLLFGFAGFVTLLSALDILVLNEVNRGMLGVIIAGIILIIGKLDLLTTDKQKEREEFLLDLVDKTCEECGSGKELLLNKDDIYCHLDGPQDEYWEACKAHAIHDMLNSWAAVLEE